MITYSYTETTSQNCTFVHRLKGVIDTPWPLMSAALYPSVQVAQGEAVVGRDEVDGVTRATTILFIEIRAATNASGKLALHARISLDEAPHAISEPQGSSGAQGSSGELRGSGQGVRSHAWKGLTNRSSSSMRTCAQNLLKSRVKKISMNQF